MTDTFVRRWKPGQPLLVQEIWQERVWSARPAVMVESTDHSAVLWLPNGSAWRAPDAPRNVPAQLSRAQRTVACLRGLDWGYLDRTWRLNTLWFLDTHVPYAVWVCWDAHGEHIGWYVNFQSPFVWRSHTVQYMDWMLDLRISPAAEVEVKDLDELRFAVTEGVLPADLESRLTRHIPAITAMATAQEGPFAERWASWRPEPHWPAVLSLPPHWDRFDTESTHPTGPRYAPPGVGCQDDRGHTALDRTDGEERLR
ncbi:DUF402 domain-containing protein [Nocardia arizonensis]|uniref:DUF402 domain-containing protein n=1 Tax=Nocardia arizonensis TaxID=1141647 RepID=UPI0006D21F5E|nr:DUF402 domain-containing protein [Nocardia arizonensis]